MFKHCIFVFLFATINANSSFSNSMTQQTPNKSSGKWLQISGSAVLLVSFFLAWVIWDGSKVSGYSMPSGDFFKISKTKFGLANPFPQLNFVFLIFWLIPAFALLIIFLAGGNRKTGLLPFITGALSLSLATVYILFTKTLIDLGVGKSIFGMLQIPLYLHIIAVIVLIFSASSYPSLLKKTGWVLAGPVFAFAGFMFAQKYLENPFDDTANVKADYTISADELIKEFISNDTATNKKYREKVLVVNGKASAVDVRNDSTSNVKFADSTGYFINFPLEKDQFDKIRNTKPGDPVSLKGVCSGSIFSEILGTTSISFKRATLNKN